MKQNRESIINFRTSEDMAAFLKTTADRFYLGNKSIAGHKILQFVSENQNIFEKWIDVDRKREAEQSLLK